MVGFLDIKLEPVAAYDRHAAKRAYIKTIFDTVEYSIELLRFHGVYEDESRRVDVVEKALDNVSFVTLLKNFAESDHYVEDAYSRRKTYFSNDFTNLLFTISHYFHEAADEANCFGRLEIIMHHKDIIIDHLVKYCYTNEYGV